MCSRAEVVIRLGADPKHPLRRSSASVCSSTPGCHVSPAAEYICILLRVMHSISTVTALLRESEAKILQNESCTTTTNLWFTVDFGACCLWHIFLRRHISMSGIFSCSVIITEAIKPQMDLLFASPLRPINDAAYELTTAKRHTKPPWKDGSTFSNVFLPRSVSGDGYIRCVTVHLLWPLCGSKGNSALRELFLILGGSACVASGALGREGMEDAGVHKLKMSVLRWQEEVQVSGVSDSGAGGSGWDQPQALLGA